MDAFLVDPITTRDISNLLLDSAGRVRVVPDSVLHATTARERFMFGLRLGIYNLPTEELCASLRHRIAGRRAIEIGAGNGVLAETLAIPATGSRLQEEPDIVAYYRAIRQPTVPYGAHVEKTGCGCRYC